MRVLVVCSYKEELNGHIAPFVKEQIEAIRAEGVECEPFFVKGKGIVGYLGNIKAFKETISSFCPNVIHAHYGLCGLLANLQHKVPVVTTYHGSDINDPKAFRFSKMAIRLSAWNIFVTRKTIEIAHPKEHYSLLPCGVDLTDLQLTQRHEARARLYMDKNKRFVLFAGAFDNPVKNVSLAKEAVALLHVQEVELLELKGYSREEVVLLMCAVDVLLMTSINEGSPQVVKEAMACGCPIVSLDVGDVRERIEGVKGCYVADTRDPQELSRLLEDAMTFGGKTEGRKKIVDEGLNNEQVASKLIETYKSILNR